MSDPAEKMHARWEYLRARCARAALSAQARPHPGVQPGQRRYLLSFLPQLKGRIDDGFRAGIDTSLYEFRAEGREPFTMLFLGNFRHTPNMEALDWFVGRVLPHVLSGEPRARLIVAGSEMPARNSMPRADAIEVIGFVEDVREPLARYALFVCPILSGSGVRVKLLGVSPPAFRRSRPLLGAEGLTAQDGAICALADSPEVRPARGRFIAASRKPPPWPAGRARKSWRSATCGQ
jgi:hypothetical protein